MPQVERYSVTAIVPTFNGAGIAEGAVASILSQVGVAVDLVVIDDGSSDGTFTMLSSRYAGDSRVTLLRNESNIGLARTLNRGLVAAHGTHLLVLHQDCRLKSETWLAKAVGLLASTDAASLVGSPLHDVGVMPRTEKWFWILRNHIYGGNAEPYSSPRDTLFSENKCDLFVTKFLQSLGGFDEGLPLGGEDQVLAVRMAEAGARTLRPPELQFVVTLGHDTSVRRNLRKEFLYGRQLRQIIRRVGVRRLIRRANGPVDRRLTNRIAGLIWPVATLLIAGASLLLFPNLIWLCLIPPLLRMIGLAVRAGRARTQYGLSAMDILLISLVGVCADIVYVGGILWPASTDPAPNSTVGVPPTPGAN